MNFLYNTAIYLYGAAAKMASIRSPKVKKMIAGQRLAFDCLKGKISDSDRPVWIHAASLGEFEQGRPLIEKIRRECPGCKILLTFFSPSGYEVRKNYGGADAVCYLPFDTPGNVRRFLDIVNPRAVVFVKYEFWGNYLQQLAVRGVPVYIISSIFRAGQVFFKPWGGMFRNMLKRFDCVYVQDENSRELLAGIGVGNVKVTGDTRFDRVTDIMRGVVEMPEIDKFTQGRLTVIAGSSWEPDEDVYMPWFNRHPEVKLIIAPHEFDDGRVRALCACAENGAVALSRLSHDFTPQVLVVDCFGKLAAMYRYADVAYIGGGFGVGIHNINEAAVYDLPVVFGPRYQKFKEAVDMVGIGAAFSVSGREQFEQCMDSLLDAAVREKAAKTAGDYIRSNLGATDRIFEDLKPLFDCN